ncbi:MAG: hypothetical protein HYV09_16235 [Deltaproteobacteria bacterium]|nr:hypothetical protein [Deltaproteobacteria bacterium]
MLHAHQVFGRAAAANDHATLAAMDPFYECASTNTWKVTEPTPTEPRAVITPPLAKWGRWLGALVAGALLSGGLYVGFDLGFQDARDGFAKKHQAAPKKTKKASVDDD